ncbi:GPI biosynthesis protein family Pig-F-domain-containing protein [Mycena floridula]|nr:GPI biosynthesis protein family Pig-F-domain-containing protein [Mycena floridula]
MAKKKAGVAPVAPAPVPVAPAPVFFPFARYCSIVGVHTTLLLFTALYLPRTALLLELTQPIAMTSKDRPQDPFLDALTANPLVTVLSISSGVTVLQGWWGGWIRSWSLDFRLASTAEGNKQVEKANLNAAKLRTLRDAWLNTAAVAAIFTAIISLFGAPFWSHPLETISLAILLSLLTVFPPAYTIGTPSMSSETDSLITRLTWVRIFVELRARSSIERALLWPAIGAIVGCWLGVIPTALDWDRPWQAWPLTPAFGSIFGFVLGSLSALVASAIQALADEQALVEQKIK